MIARSSAQLEDSETTAAAGLFHSEPNIQSKEELAVALKKVLCSAFSPQVISFFRERNFEDWHALFEISVIIQKYESESEYSGVVFSVGRADNWDIAGMQVVTGLGGGVDGHQTPATAFINKDSFMIEELHFGANKLPVSISEVRELTSLLKMLEEKFQMPIEIEFAGKAILQIRPITRYARS